MFSEDWTDKKFLEDLALSSLSGVFLQRSNRLLSATHTEYIFTR